MEGGDSPRVARASLHYFILTQSQCRRSFHYLLMAKFNTNYSYNSAIQPIPEQAC